MSLLIATISKNDNYYSFVGRQASGTKIDRTHFPRVRQRGSINRNKSKAMKRTLFNSFRLVLTSSSTHSGGNKARLLFRERLSPKWADMRKRKKKLVRWPEAKQSRRPWESYIIGRQRYIDDAFNTKAKRNEETKRRKKANAKSSRPQNRFPALSLPPSQTDRYHHRSFFQCQLDVCCDEWIFIIQLDQTYFFQNAAVRLYVRRRQSTVHRFGVLNGRFVATGDGRRWFIVLLGE